jgi:hypothetical protein
MPKLQKKWPQECSLCPVRRVKTNQKVQTHIWHYTGILNGNSLELKRLKRCFGDSIAELKELNFVKWFFNFKIL